MKALATLLAWMLLEANPREFVDGGDLFVIGLGDREAWIVASFGEWVGDEDEKRPTTVTIVSAEIRCDVEGCHSCGVTRFEGGPYTIDLSK